MRSFVSHLLVLQRPTIEIYEVLSFKSPIVCQKKVTEKSVTKLDYLVRFTLPDTFILRVNVYPRRRESPDELLPPTTNCSSLSTFNRYTDKKQRHILALEYRILKKQLRIARILKFMIVNNLLSKHNLSGRKVKI